MENWLLIIRLGKRYLSSYFIIDTLSILPLPQVCIIFQSLHHDKMIALCWNYGSLLERWLYYWNCDYSIEKVAHYWNGGYTIGMVVILLKMWLTIGMVAILLEWWLYY